MTEFSKEERDFLNSLEEARIATSHDNKPHVKPVSYILIKDSIVIATDSDTRTLKNLKQNQNVALSIDKYEPGRHKAICIQGIVEIIERGEEFQEFYKEFYEKFSWVRSDPWQEGEAPFLKITTKGKTSWGLNQ